MAGRINKYELILLILLPVGVVFYFFRRFQVDIPVLSDHLNDLLFIPLMISLITVVFRRILHIDLRPDLFKTLFAVIFCSLYFEYFLPLTNINYTSDWKDVFCYFAGGAIIHIFLSKPAREYSE
jgi:hypothetical protein